MGNSLELAGRLAAVVEAQQEVLGVITNLEKVMNVVVSRVPQVTGGTGAVIEMVDGDAMVYRAASGTAREHIGLRLRREGSLSGLAVKANEVLRCDDTDSDVRVDGAACREIGIRSMIIAPLSEGEKAVGALKSYAPFARAFDDLDSYALQLLAGMTSLALTQARSYREREASEARYRLLFERNVAGVFRSSLDGRILDCNDALVHYLGFDSREELLSRPAWDLYHFREDREAFLQHLSERRAQNLRISFRRKDGTPMMGVVNAELVPNEEGERQLLGTIVEA